jgi:hypothetical protein
MTLEKVKQGRDAVLNDKVDHEKVQRKNGNRDYDHGGRGSHFFPRGRGHFAHFGAHVVVERPGALRPSLYRRYKCVLFRHGRHLLLLSSFFFLLPSSRSVFSPAHSGRQILAGAEGFEPPSSVLETDSLTVELTPLKPIADCGLMMVALTISNPQ